MGNIFVVTKMSTLLIITRGSSGLKKSQMLIFSKCKYLHVKIASLANVKSCVTVGPISLVANVWSCMYSPSGLALRLSSLTEDT